VVNQYEQQRARNFLSKQADTQLRQYLGTLPPADRANYLQAQQQVLNGDDQQDDEPDAPEGPQRAPRSPFHMRAYSQSHPMQNDFIERFGPVAQGKHLDNMVSDVQNAYQDENDSRVAQAREQARMAHESDMAGMEYDALIQRLQMEADQREKDRILQKQLTSGVTNRQFINGRWVDV
jgi:hypothetical protein